MIRLPLAIARLLAHGLGERFGSWIRTSTGGRFWPLDPRPADVFIADIARGLANTCRYNGQLREPGRHYSVAEHSVLVSIASGALARSRGFSSADVLLCECLGQLHDATEAYVADIVRPLKRSWLLAGYRAAEAHLLCVILRAHGIDRAPARCWAVVHEIDRRILVDEMVALMNGCDTRGYGEALGCEIEALTPALAEDRFLDRYRDLGLAVRL